VQSESVVQARAFEPLAPPTPAEVAAGDGVKWFFVVGSIFAVAALALGYEGHLKAAAFAVLGALLVPMLGELATSKLAQLVAVGLGAVSLALWGAWHLMSAQQHEAALGVLSTGKAAAEAEIASLKVRLSTVGADVGGDVKTIESKVSSEIKSVESKL
jgi:hypothetical protein